MSRRCYLFFLCAALVAAAAGCSGGGANTGPASPTPSNKFTSADVAKLKWIEGTWRGMDGDKPFFERYRVDGDALIVESFDDGTLANVSDTTRFELKNGEFGSGEGDKRRAAASITENAVQFVPGVAGKGNMFRFERGSGNNWKAVLEWPASADKPAGQKVYTMEPWKPEQRP